MTAKSVFAAADQVVVSSRNIAFLLLAASLTRPADFALLAIWLTAVQLVTGLFSASVVDPWLVNEQASPETRPSRLMVLVAGAFALVVVLTVGDLLLVAAWGLLPLACLLEERRATAHLAESWAVVGVTGLLPVVCMFTGAWVSPGALGLTLGLLAGMAIAALPTLVRPRRVVPANFRLSGGFAFDFLTSAGYGQVIVLIIAAFLSPVEAGALRLGQQFFSLPSIALSGLRLTLLPKKNKSVSRTTYLRYVRYSAMASTVLASVIWYVLAIASSWMAGPVAEVVDNITFPLALQSAVLGLYTLAPILLKRLARTTVLVWARLITVVLSASMVGLGTVLAGVTGAAWGLACGSFIGLVVWHSAAWRHIPMAH